MEHNNYQFFVLPGNPPSSYFYNLWKEDLLTYFPNSSVKILNYKINNEFDSSDFFYQLARDLAIEVNNSQSKCKILISHSLGGYFGFRIQHHLSQENIRHISFFPFLGNPHPRAWFKLKTLSLLEKSHFLKAQFTTHKDLLSLLEPSIKAISSQELSLALSLAYHESKYFKNIQKIPIRKNDQDKVFSNPRDLWFRPAAKNWLEQRVKVEQTQLQHDFVCYEKQRVEASLQVRDWLNHLNLKY